MKQFFEKIQYVVYVFLLGAGAVIWLTNSTSAEAEKVETRVMLQVEQRHASVVDMIVKNQAETIRRLERIENIILRQRHRDSGSSEYER